MSERVDYYDLGDVDALPEPSRAMEAPRARGRVRPRSAGATAGASSMTTLQAVASSVSIFVPGLGHALQRDPMWSVLLLSWTGFTVAAGWALLMTRERLAGTLGALALPPELPFLALLVLFAALALVHVVGVVHAHGPTVPGTADRAPHPVVSSVASLLVPGWGQVLNHQPRRAAIFLAGTWAAVGCWLVALAPRLLWVRDIVPSLPPELATGIAPVALIVATSGIWSAAVYDAAASAASKRRRV